MPTYTEKIEQQQLPVVALRGTVAFPGIPVSIEVVRPSSVAACEAASASSGTVFVVAQREISVEKPMPEDLYKTGTVARIKQSVKTSEGNIRLILEGQCRAEASEYFPAAERGRGKKYMTADVICKTVSVNGNGGVRGEALMLEAVHAFESFSEKLPAVSDEMKLAVKGIKTPGLLADFIASNALIRYADKQRILERFDPLSRLELLTVILESEEKLLECEMDIHKRVRSRIDSNQRDYYLREQLKVIQEELGEDDAPGEIDEYYYKIDHAHFSDEVRDKLEREVARLSKMPFGSAEGGVLRNYLDICLSLPWDRLSTDRCDIERAKKVLDRDHDGLTKVKERILEFIAVKQLSPDLGNQIICLVGPPGVGKTSVAVSIARALGRKYARVSLGGIRDEADIRGHRKTYVGAMPGRIIEAIDRAGTRNPLILLDEIDKITRDAHGDPSSALLEVLDNEQNKNFRDHFIELPLDLSKCLFIATANTLDGVPEPLIDRMEIIELHTYSRAEKLMIAKHHLIKKQMKRHGLTAKQFSLSDSAVYEIIDYYTREAGVRNLEREIASLCRKAAKRIVEAKVPKVSVTGENVSEYLGKRKCLPELIDEKDTVGVVNGLAYTEYGGDVLKVEAAVLEGSGKIELTGSLGDVMKESAHIAVSYIREKARELGIDPEFYKDRDIHIHVPEGAVPKDGPSAGITMMTALASALTGRPAVRDTAMTGELSLRGRVLPIGGLREKTMAAYVAGVSRVIIPKKNLPDLDEIDEDVRKKLTFIPVEDAEEVLSLALLPAGSSGTDGK